MSKELYGNINLENQLCFPLYAASREVIKAYRPYLEELDLTYTQYITMVVLWQEKKISAKDLGKKLFLDSGTLTPVLKSLESKGLVTRNRFIDDERILMVEVTDAGYAMKETASSIPERVSECIELDYDEIYNLYKLLYKLLGSFEK
ncbi:MAG: MarR family transcriptional regulator [Clostridia bacterium]|nr:MarR family transcriptional regulator [Clostridia bacterium]